MFKKTVVKGFKGFDENFKCRDFQFEVGKEYKHKGDIKLCASGFHFVENPLEVFDYYLPATSKFAEVEGSAVSDEKESDSKRVAKVLKVVAELSLHNLCNLGAKFILDKVDFKNAKETNTGNRSASTNTGDRSASTNTGDRSASTNTGDRSASTNTGDRSASTNTGDRSASTNTGDRSASTNTGYQSASTNTGYQSASTNTGDRSASTNTGDRSASTNTGDRSASTNTGYQSASTNTGYQSASTNTGYQSASTNTGDRSASTNTGYQSASTNTGDQSASTNTGKEGCAISLGIEGKARGAKGCWLTLAEWAKINGEWHRINVQTTIVDGKTIKADTFYMLCGGSFIEAND